MLDQVYGSELAALRNLWEVRTGQGRTLTHVADVARAATFGAVDTVLVDIDAVVPGTIDEDIGAVSFAPEGATSYGVVDEIALRVWLNSGRVLAVRTMSRAIRVSQPSSGPPPEPRRVELLACRALQPSRHRSSTMSSRGCEQQMNTLPSAGGSTGSGR